MKHTRLLTRVALICFCGLIGDPSLGIADATHHIPAVATSDGIALHSRPERESPIVGRVWHGVRMKAYSFQKGWILVEVSSGERGWIRGEHVETLPPEERQETLGRPSGAELSVEEAAPYRIQVGDSIIVKSYRNPEIDGVVTVRPDGCISLLFVDDVKVAGLTPDEVDKTLTTRYKKYFQSPDVTVIVGQSREVLERRVYVGGEVAMPREIPLQAPTTVLQAIFAAGGFADTAKKKNIILIRKGEGNRPLIYSLNLDDIENGKSVSNNIYLEPFDIVYVPPTAIAKADLFVKQYINKIIPERLSFGFSWFPFPD